jgi:hypothetical protein
MSEALLLCLPSKQHRRLHSSQEAHPHLYSSLKQPQRAPQQKLLKRDSMRHSASQRREAHLSLHQRLPHLGVSLAPGAVDVEGQLQRRAGKQARGQAVSVNTAQRDVSQVSTNCRVH